MDTYTWALLNNKPKIPSRNSNAGLARLAMKLLLPLLLWQATVASAAGVFDVTKYGAKGDSTSVDSAAVRAAAAACSSAGGGTVLFPRAGC